VTLSTAEALARIQEIGRPVLSLDACVVLDAAREPTRKKYTANHVSAVLEIVARAEAAPPELVLLVSETAFNEVLEHLDQLETECGAALQTLDLSVERVAGIFKALGLPVDAPKRLSDLGYPAAARALAERLLRLTNVVEDEEACKVRAMDRVRGSVAPARRGKEAAKDCLIVETNLQIVQRLRAAGFGQKVVFLTSNTADFCSGGGRNLHEDLAPQFQAVDLEFASDWTAARYAI